MNYTLPLFDQEPTHLGTMLISALRQYVPARTRSNDPITSFEAAASWTKERLTRVQMIVWSFFLMNTEGTDGALEEWVARTYPDEKFGASSLRKRRGDLVEKGILCDSGRKDEARNMIIWESVRKNSPEVR